MLPGVPKTVPMPEGPTAMPVTPDLAFLRGVFAASADCIKLIDEQGRLCLMNANGLALMQIVDFDALRGAPWDSLWPEPGATRVREAIARGLQGEGTRFEAFCPTAAGTPKWWDVQVQPLPPDMFSGCPQKPAFMKLQRMPLSSPPRSLPMAM